MRGVRVEVIYLKVEVVKNGDGGGARVEGGKKEGKKGMRVMGDSEMGVGEKGE